MPLEIVIKKEPPKQLLRVIKEECDCQHKDTKENLINKVTIDANSERLDKDSIGGFFPETKEIVIDLAHCVENKGWMGFGMMMIQTVWFNMLRAVFHETGHATQLAKDPSIIKMKILTPELEQEADAYATEMIQYWAENGGTIPKIDEMGWAGEQIKLIINTCYGNKELRPKIMEELSVLEANGVAELDTFTIHNTKLIADGSYDTLCEAIDSKDVGIKINNKRYLDPKGFFSFILDENKAAQDRDVDNAYNHIQRDLDNPNFHGIPGTSGTPDEGVPIELAMPEHLNKLKTLKKKESDKCQ